MYNDNIISRPQSTDWLSAADQLVWFKHFRSKDAAGLKFSDFERFLNYALYAYSRSFHLKEGSSGQNNDFGYSNQQEMQLFNKFDTRNDHIIDREEFGGMCQTWLSKIYHSSSALVIVDVQNDFIDGSLALINGPAKQDGAEVVPVINKLVERCHFDTIVYTQDWHPIDHIGFHANLPLRKYIPKNSNGNSNKPMATTDSDSNTMKESDSNNGDKTDSNKFKLKRLSAKVQVFDTVLFDDGRMEQKLWPVHCVQNSWGAELHPKLLIAPDSVRIYKGTLPQVDAYSAFWDNMRLNETGLRQELNSRKINDVFVCGLALDYCVAASAMDSVRSGFMTFIVEDACRGIDSEEIERRKQEMLSMGIVFINSEQVKGYLSLSHGKFSAISHNHVDQTDDQRASPRNLTSSDIVASKRLIDRELFMNICLRRALIG